MQKMSKNWIGEPSTDLDKGSYEEKIVLYKTMHWMHLSCSVICLATISA